ncbi:Nucleolar protein [Gracilaria domingensis]|nr:Nucleolar protein [Gracilaria domingensis]
MTQPVIGACVRHLPSVVARGACTRSCAQDVSSLTGDATLVDQRAAGTRLKTAVSRGVVVLVTGLAIIILAIRVGAGVGVLWRNALRCGRGVVDSNASIQWRCGRYHHDDHDVLAFAKVGTRLPSLRDKELFTSRIYRAAKPPRVIFVKVPGFQNLVQLQATKWQRDNFIANKFTVAQQSGVDHMRNPLDISSKVFEGRAKLLFQIRQFSLTMPSASRGRQGAPVVYSAEAHREFVTGFRQRKQQRRQEAQKRAAEQQKKEKREERKQRRDVFRANREQIQADSEDEQEDTKSVRQSTQFQGPDGVVTAVVQPLDFGKPGILPQTSQEILKSQGQTGDQQPSQPSKDSRSPPRRSVFKLGVVNPKKKSWKRKISYTHMLSKGNLRKAKLKRRKEARSNAS